MNARIKLQFALALSTAAMACAEDRVKDETVHFARGSTSATLQSSIRGYDMARYRLELQAGQDFTIVLKAKNSSCYFSALAPNGDSPFADSSMSGENSFRGKVPKTGTTTVQVFLFRNAARRKEICAYTLTLGAK